MGSFAEDSAYSVVLLGLLALEFLPLLVELPCEVGVCYPPQLIGCLLPVVQEFGLEQATGVHLGHKVVHLVVVGDSDPMVFSLDLAPVELARNGGDVRVWSVTPWREEVGFGIQIILGGNSIPRAELGNHCLDHLVFVTYLVFLEFLDVLCVNGRDDGFYRHQFNHLLEGVILPLNPMVRLELKELAPLGAVLGSWVEEIGFFEMFAVEVVDSGGELHFGLDEYKREKPVLPTPFGCREMAR